MIEFLLAAVYLMVIGGGIVLGFLLCLAEFFPILKPIILGILILLWLSMVIRDFIENRKNR